MYTSIFIVSLDSFHLYRAICLIQACEENLIMPSGISSEGEEYEGATVIEPEKG